MAQPQPQSAPAPIPASEQADQSPTQPARSLFEPSLWHAADAFMPRPPRTPEEIEQINADGDVFTLSPIGEHLLSRYPVVVTSRRGYLAGLRHWLQAEEVAQDLADEVARGEG